MLALLSFQDLWQENNNMKIHYKLSSELHMGIHTVKHHLENSDFLNNFNEYISVYN